MSLVLDTGAMKYRENPSQPWRPLVIKAGMNWESMADTYDPDNGTYEVGQYVLEEGMMYRCIYEITTPEAWTPAHWTSTNVADELASFIIISDDQPTEDSNKIWIAETTSPFGVQIPTMDDHNALGNTLNAVEDSLAPLELTGTNTTGSTIKAGTFFYNNGTLVYAKTDIGINAGISGNNTADASADGALNKLSIGYFDVPVGELELSRTDGSWKYQLVDMNSYLPSGARVISVSWSADSMMANVSITNTPRYIVLMSTYSVTISNGLSLRAWYIKL